MKLAKTTLCALTMILAMFSTLASAQKVKSDYDHSYKLAGLRTFAFAPLSEKDPLSARPDVANKIKSDLKSQLEKIGLQEDDQQPNFLVSYSASKQTYTTSYSTGASAWTAGSQVWNTEYTEGTLVVDFLDPATRAPFWRGTATQTVYAGTLQKYVPKGVEKLVDAFQKDLGEKER